MLINALGYLLALRFLFFYIMIDVNKKFEDFKLRLRQEYLDFKAEANKWYDEVIRPLDKNLSKYGLEVSKNPRISSKECEVYIRKSKSDYGDNACVILRFQRGCDSGLLDNWTDKVYYRFEQSYGNDYGSANYYDFFKKLFIYFNLEKEVLYHE